VTAAREHFGHEYFSRRNGIEKVTSYVGKAAFFMGTRIQHMVTNLLVTGMLVTTCGCSIFVSTPHTAKICIHALDNTLNESVVALDQPVDETNMGIRISKNYTLQLDFEWLWDSGTDSRVTDSFQDNDDATPPLIPWIVCKYRF
jgi:hypothetical protein